MAQPKIVCHLGEIPPTEMMFGRQYNVSAFNSSRLRQIQKTGSRQSFIQHGLRHC